jgi:hypothetical protein
MTMSAEQGADSPRHPGGRPTKFKPEYVEQVRKLCTLGATDVEIADFFEISIPTIYNWANTVPEFFDALRVGKDAADERVVRSLYGKATGYTFESEKVFQYDGQIIRTAIREHVPPSDTAAIFWLKNRRRAEWRDKHEHEVTGKDGGPIAFSRARSKLADLLASEDEPAQEG